MPLFALVPLLVVLTVALHAPFLFFGIVVLFVMSRGGHRRHRAHGHYGWR